MKTLNQALASILFFITILMPWAAHGAPSLNITPSGTLSYVANVPIVITLNNPENLQIVGFTVSLNSQDVTPAFTQAAQITNNGTTTTARVEYLFAPGEWQVAATVTLRNADGNGVTEIVATSPFTIPGDAQDRRKATILSKISGYMNQYSSYMFNSFINLGDYSKFQNRINESDVQVYIDPAYLDQNQAEYVENYWWRYVIPIYVHDLVIRAEPENYTLGGNTYNSQTLWHEMIHAISHGVQVATGTAPLPMDDHAYQGRLEACVNAIDNNLIPFENYMTQNGKNPTAPVPSDIRNKWKFFHRFCTESNWSAYASLGYPTDAQMAGFKNLTGIDVNPNTIKQGYLGMGYSPLYFADISVAITSPSTGTETNENQVKVEATFTNNEPNLTVDRVGFSVNGAIQEAPRAGNVFGTTAVLKTGDNSIIAGVQMNDGQVFTSTPITVKSNALNNTYHARISWDKNDTDVDLHFSWSGGSECFYSNKAPIWGTAATSPRLDVDNTSGFGPENITIGGLPGSGTYKIFVYYFSDHGKGGTNVNATIYKDGVPIYSGSQYMTDHGTWTLVEFTVP